MGREAAGPMFDVKELVRDEREVTNQLSLNELLRWSKRQKPGSIGIHYLSSYIVEEGNEGSENSDGELSDNSV
ncbi:TonB-dependent receptor [Sesbania bispinosa]|nr:TonB-dependent receptor [Sesbania bispinosa]